jgi:lipopolysaccharide export system protein LptA
MIKTRPWPPRDCSRTAAWPCGLMLAVLCAPAIAQVEADLPVRISADSAQMDDRRGIGTYSGNVVVTRGDLTLQADRITIHTPERRPVRMEAHGDPVRAEAPDAAGQLRVATARRMEYGFDEQVLLLLEDARVQTPTEDARGDRITYDLVEDIIRIEGGPGQRVEITIQPRPE